MKSARLIIFAAVSLATAATTATYAATISGSWTLIQDGGGADLTAVGGTLANPSIGDGLNTNSAGNAAIAGAFSNINLANAGDTITLTGSFSLVGGGGTNFQDQFRFGLFNDPADTAVGAVTSNGGASPSNNTGWLGYFVSNSHNTSTGRLAERANSNTGLPISGTGTANVQTHLATGSAAFDITSSSIYSFTLTLARQANGSLNIDYSLTNGAGYVLTGVTANDTSPNTYDFDRVGFLIGGNLSAEQANFSNVDVTFSAVPEPSAALLGGFGMLVGFGRRRRSV